MQFLERIRVWQGNYGYRRSTCHLDTAHVGVGEGGVVVISPRHAGKFEETLLSLTVHGRAFKEWG